MQVIASPNHLHIKGTVFGQPFLEFSYIKIGYMLNCKKSIFRYPIGVIDPIASKAKMQYCSKN